MTTASIKPKVITSADLRSHLGPTLDEVAKSKQPILVRRHRQVDVALVDIEMLEDLLLMNNEEFLKSIEEARKSVAAGNVYTLDEVIEDLKLRRKKR